MEFMAAGAMALDSSHPLVLENHKAGESMM